MTAASSSILARGKRRRALACMLSVAGAGLGAAPAAAEEPPAAPPLAQEAAPTQPDGQQGPASAQTEADALFQEGKRLFEAGQYAEACAKLARSDALDPTIGSLGLLAGCHEHEGRTATAWREYQITAERAEAAGDERVKFARERAAALEPRVPRLLIQLQRPAPGLQVLRNREAVPASELGVAMPVDPGAYAIVARAAGREDFSVTVTLKEGAQAVVTVPALEAPRAPVSEAGPRPRPRAPEPAPRPGDGRRPAALISGGVGLVGLGVGIGFGLSAMSKGVESRTLREASSTPEDRARGRALMDDALTDSTVSTVSFGIGLAGLGASALLLLLPSSGAEEPQRPARSAVQVAPVAGARGGGAVVTGRF